MSCRLVIYNVPDDPFALRNILVERLGIHPAEAQRLARSAPGMLPEPLDAEVAAGIVQSVKALGVAAAALPDENIPKLDHSELVHHARCLATGLEIVGLRGESECVIPWNDLRLISVGQAPVEGAMHFHAEPTAVVTAAPHPHHPTTVARQTAIEAWFVRDNPWTAFRMDHSLMNYEYLGERKTGSAASNFRLFLEDVVARAQHAYLTPATRACLEHGLLRHYEFDSREELRHYTVLHLLLAQQADAAPPGGQTATRA